MVWHYHDDDVPGPDARVLLEISGFKASADRALVTHYRVDERHGNAYAAWHAMGSPLAPNEKQYAELQEAGRLATLNPPENVRFSGGGARIEFTLPRRGVSLLVLDGR